MGIPSLAFGWATCVTEIGTSGELSGFPRLSFQLDGACRSPELMRSAGQAPVAVGKLALAAKPTDTAAFSMLLVAENVKFGRIDELPVPKGKQRPHLVAQVISRGCCLITANRVWLGAWHCRGRRTTPPKHQSLAPDCVSNPNNANPEEPSNGVPWIPAMSRPWQQANDSTLPLPYQYPCFEALRDR